MTATLDPVEAPSPLTPTFTPRPTFQVTRRLVGVSRWPLILLTAVYAINVSDQYLLPAMFPLLKQEFGISDTGLGILSGSYLLTVTVLTVPFGIAADRYRRTRIIAWGTAAWGMTMVWTGMARNYGTLFASRMVLGAWDPADNPTSQSLLADYYPVHQRSKVMGVYQIGQLAGIFALPLAGAMAQAWGWRATFFFFSLPAFVVAVLAWRLPEPQRGEQDRRHQNLEARTEAKSMFSDHSVWQAYREILRVRTYVAALVSSTIASLFFGGIGVWTVTFLIRFHDLTLAESTSAISLFALGGLVGAVLSGYVADYLTHAGHRAARVFVAGTARLLTMPLLLLAFWIENTPLMLTLFTVGAMTLTAAQPPLNAARADVLHPGLRGRGTSLDAVCQSIAGAASPVIFGILADAYDLRTAFLVLIPLTGVAGLVLLTLGLASYGRDERRVEELIRREAGAEPVVVTEPGPDAPVEADAVAGDVLLEVEDIDVAYGAVQVLFGTSLELPRGGCHALVGRNGAGKTTLLDTIAGLIEPRAGRLHLNGAEITGVPPEQRVRLGITLMAGGRSTFPSMTVHDNLWLGAYPFCNDERLVQDRLDAVLDVFPVLRDRLGQAGGTLSGGEQQMVALARALMAGPELLLIDELSLGLAPVVTTELLRVIREITALGTTILMVEQSVHVALEVADEVFVMERGKVIPVGRAADLGDGAELGRMMLDGVVPT
jgi:ABC-type branched-subunit amino acid transport system ATPase component/sugar phosphate permease